MRDTAKRHNPKLRVTAPHGGDIARQELPVYLQTAPPESQALLAEPGR